MANEVADMLVDMEVDMMVDKVAKMVTLIKIDVLILIEQTFIRIKHWSSQHKLMIKPYYKRS